MSKPRWYEKLLDTTRGKVLVLLRTEPRTVRDLAGELELTGNAVRRHLTALERDGLVATAGVRREGVGKPARIYELTDEARDFFPQAHGVLLDGVLSVLESRCSDGELEELLRDVGRRMAVARKEAGFPTRESLEVRVRTAARVMEEIGGMPEVERTNGHFLVRGRTCPMAAIVESHPGACTVPEAFFEELLDTCVRERCDRSDRPRCRFEIGAADESEEAAES